MLPTSKPSKVGLRFMGMMRTAIKVQNGAALAAICHRVLVGPAPDGPTTAYTVYLAPDDRGTFLVTCRELPDLLTFGEDEDEALSMAEIAIEEAIGVRPSSADFPY